MPTIRSISFLASLLVILSSCTLGTIDPPPGPNANAPRVESTEETVAGANNVFLLLGTFIGTCNSQSNGYWSNGTPSSSTWSDTTVITMSANLDGSTILINGYEYDRLSGNDPSLGDVVYQSNAHFPTRWTFSDNGMHLERRWGASSPGGWANETCHLDKN